MNTFEPPLNTFELPVHDFSRNNNTFKFELSAGSKHRQYKAIAQGPIYTEGRPTQQIAPPATLV